MLFLFFFFNDTATTEIYTLSLHDALPISSATGSRSSGPIVTPLARWSSRSSTPRSSGSRSEEHTSELQSRLHLVCRLLLEKKKKKLPSTACEDRSLGSDHALRRTHRRPVP